MRVEVSWALATLFKYKIYFVKENDKIIHISYCVYRCFKFPFLKGNDIQIGPCHTAIECRGRGIYPKVISYICQNEQKNNGGKVYMIINDKNCSSQKGVYKAGFVKVAKLKKSKVFKIYQMLEE